MSRLRAAELSHDGPLPGDRSEGHLHCLVAALTQGLTLVLLHVVTLLMRLEAMAIGAKCLEVGRFVIESIPVNVIHVELTGPCRDEAAPNALFALRVLTVLVSPAGPTGLSGPLQLVAAHTGASTSRVASKPGISPGRIMNARSPDSSRIQVILGLVCLQSVTVGTECLKVPRFIVVMISVNVIQVQLAMPVGDKGAHFTVGLLQLSQRATALVTTCRTDALVGPLSVDDPI